MSQAPVSHEPTVALWIDGSGHPLPVVAAALRSAVRQGIPFREIIVFADAAAELGSVAGESAPPVRVVVLPSDDCVILNELLADTTAAWLAWLDASSVLLPGALAIAEPSLGRFDVDLFYGDSRLDAHTVVRRPAPSPIRLRSQDYLGGFRGVRIDALRAAGGFQPDARGAHPYDFSLRLGTVADRVLAIPVVLTESRAITRKHTPAHRTGAQLAAAQRHLAALGIEAELSDRGIRYPLRASPLVSIIIPTRGGRAVIGGVERTLVVEAVRGIVERSTYSSLEFVIVADEVMPQVVVDELVEIAGDRVRLVRWAGPFNFSGKINRGAVHALGDYLVLLNDDVELITPDWIEAMLGLAQQPGVGMVGALLYFEDGSIQHGGHLYNAGRAGHIAFNWDADRDDALGSLSVDREVSGVTGACVMLSADAFWNVGGLSTEYPGNYNDVDLALKIRSTGASILWTPHARLFHFESKTRVATVAHDEVELLCRHWGTKLLADPYWR
jgi:GT2 family glycosyltransferase